MLTQWEKNQIVEMTKTASWGFLKKFFQEKKRDMQNYMENLDIDSEQWRKEFKNKKLSLDAFSSLLVEIEKLAEEVATQEAIDKSQKEQEEFINPK